MGIDVAMPMARVEHSVSLEPGVLQAVGMLAVDGDRVGLEQAGQPQGLVDLVEMVHPVVVADHLAHAGAATAHQAIVGFAAEGHMSRQRCLKFSSSISIKVPDTEPVYLRYMT